MTAPIPSTIEQAISPAWLSAAISERHTGTRVTEVATVSIVKAVAARARITVDYDGRHVGELPTHLFVKGGFAPDTRHLLEGGAYYREARFYRDVAPQLDVGMPLCVHASVDEPSRQGVVVLEDLLSAGATLFRLGDTHSVAEVGAFVDELARLHALSHRMLAEDPDRFDWVPRTAEVVPRLIKKDPIALLAAHLDGERGAVVPSAMRDPARVLAALRALMASDRGGDGFLLHGDMHLGNIYMRGDGRPGWYDWQTLQRGSWAMDAIYYIVGSLDPADRRAHFSGLLARYIDGLAASGGPEIVPDDADALYRRYLAYGLFIWSVARETIVPIETLTRLLPRFALAAEEADTFGALGV
jgi:hypothetical protein